MELKTGQIVFSRRGRDAGEAYVVAGVQPQRVLLANGREKTLLAPKAKNPRHVNPTGTVLPPERTDTDLQIKTALRVYLEQHGLPQQGGQELGER